ncbi:pancreatic lipase-related protein 2 [Parasteatoda tepidariorum]|uniref:pancreatic lipase-related protein 2 n=1 Tax=Parasteatoda tepidariorum TaxID=114398 RepID=UPI001C71C64B|nr:pancreatic lipase-related protein 2 [Parasteatoda tepidariorum]
MTIFLALCFIWCASVTYGSPIGGNDTAQRGLDIDVDAWGKKEVCMKELGCFAITDDFKSLLHRPVNVLPHDRATINARSLLYTRKNAKESHVLVASDKESFTESNLNKDNPTKFIVHGFMDSELYGPWMLAMKDEFLMHGDYNIIVVDWSGGNKPPYYQATSNTRVVGAEIALIIKALEKYAGIKRENCHIIGHSLGSHVAGYAGAILKTLGRITGCDPAEPYFQNMPTSVRLDPSDADYVDVIHSDATDIMFIGFGMSHSVGHVDFFPNNGRKQPGCKADKFKSFITDGLNEGARRFVSCNHQRSLDFFYHSINYRKVVPVGYECTSWNDFLAGKCAECGPDTKRCAIMGIRADEYYEFRNSSVQRNMYLQTSGKSPFWLYHYQVTVKLYRPKASYKDVEGTMDITLVGSKGDELAHIQQKATEFFHGARYQYLVTTERDLGEIKSVTLKWFSSSNNPIKMIFKPKLYVEYVTVIPMNVIEKSPRTKKNRSFCAKPENGITPKTITTLHRDDKCVR